MQPPPYDPQCPANSSDSFAVTQPTLMNNFSTLFDAFLVNHISLTAASGAGNHNVIQLTEASGDFQTGPSQLSLYTKGASETGTTDQIFIKNGATQEVYQYTAYQIYQLVPFDAFQTSYFTFLPGRLLVYFGFFLQNQQVNNGIIKLYPPIAKNIVSITGCFSNQPPLGTGIFNIMDANSSGYFDKIFYATNSTNQNSTQYLIVANI